MKKINVEIKGICPLLQHRFPEEEHGVNASKKKKQRYDPKEEAEKALYTDEKGKIYQPSDHILGALIKAGTDFKYKGRKTYKEIIKAGVVIEPDAIPLEHKEWVIDSRNVVVQRSRIVRYRPKFNEWSLSFDIIIIDDDNIPISTINEILERAGTKVGIGDYRPRFGRFIITKFNVSDK